MLAEQVSMARQRARREKPVELARLLPTVSTAALVRVATTASLEPTVSMLLQVLQVLTVAQVAQVQTALMPLTAEPELTAALA